MIKVFSVGLALKIIKASWTKDAKLFPYQHLPKLCHPLTG